MGKPFQFSIGQMLVATALFCLGIGLFFAGRDAQKMGPNPIAVFIIIFGTGAAVGCGVGVLTGKPTRCAVYGGVLAIAIALAYAMLAISMHWRP